MKKILACVLSMILLLSCMALPAGAVDGACDCGKAPIIRVCGFGNTVYNGDAVAFPPQRDAILRAIPRAIPLLPALLRGDLSDSQLEKTLAIAASFFAPIAFDTNGNPANAAAARFTYPTTENHRAGALINFDYDWRMDPFQIAAELKDFIDYVKQLTGHDSVYLVGESMGTIMMNTYLAEYGFDGIEGVIWYNGAYNGVETCSDSFADKNRFELSALNAFLKQVAVNADNTQLYDLFVALNDSGVLPSVFDAVMKTADRLQEKGYYTKFLNETIGRIPGFWSLVSSENFDTAVENVFPTDALKTEFAGLIAKITRYHDEVSTQVDRLMAEAQERNLKVGVVCGYGSYLAPVTADNTQQSDGTIGTASESNGATCAPLGETLGAAYVQAVDDGHDHISPDLVIDASTGFFPDHTWYVKFGGHHFSSGGYSRELIHKIFFDEDFDVFSDAQFPQFMVLDADTDTLAPLTDENAAGKTGAPTLLARVLTVFMKMASFFTRLTYVMVTAGR